jgi:AAA15 family ATPase/GTPase
VFVIDEFDRSLHPEVSHSLLADFLNYSQGRESQLIVTTHETSLMDQNFLRRDEIWMVEKGPDHASRLIALEEYKGVREGDDLQRDYRNGRFGGVPVLRDFSWMGEANAPGT